jgi:hypothetical protein
LTGNCGGVSHSMIFSYYINIKKNIYSRFTRILSPNRTKRLVYFPLFSPFLYLPRLPSFGASFLRVVIFMSVVMQRAWLEMCTAHYIPSSRSRYV